MTATGNQGRAGQFAQIEYLQALQKVKDDEIETLKLQLRAGKLREDFEQFRIERALEQLYFINREMQRRVPDSPIPNNFMAWWIWRQLPWWKRIFRRPRSV